jgi:hypothetical protein
MRCSSSLDSIVTIAADGSASSARVISAAACWGERVLKQRADTRAADGMARASPERSSHARDPLSHVSA